MAFQKELTLNTHRSGEIHGLDLGAGWRGDAV
jgi:hypothetical protein